VAGDPATEGCEGDLYFVSSSHGADCHAKSVALVVVG
jgi:hypothetical protein